MAEEPAKKPTLTLGADGIPVDAHAVPPKKVIRTYATDLALASGKQPAPPNAAPTPPQKPAISPPPPVPETRPDPRPEPAAPLLPPIPPKPPAPVVFSMPEPVPAQEPSPPQKMERVPAEKPAPPPYEVARDLEAKPSAISAAPALRNAPEAYAEPGFFARLMMMLFGTSKKPAEEGRILTSTVIRRDAKPAPPPVPRPAPAPEIPVAPPAPPPSLPPKAETQADREAVLARLRARVAAREGEAPPPVFPTPRPEQSEAPRPPAYQGPPANLPGAPKEPPPPEPLQTYSGDFARRIDRERASTFAVIAADADRRTTPITRQRTPQKNPGFLYVVISTILLVGGTTSLYFAYSYFSGNQPVSITRAPASTLIAADESVSIRREDGDPYRLFRDAAEMPLPNGGIRVITFTIATTSGGASTDVLQTGTTFLRAMRLRAPDLLMRNLRPESTVGAVGANGEAHPFFILSTVSYQRTFAAMLDWEDTIAEDLALLYPRYQGPAPAPESPRAEEATTTEASATTTPAEPLALAPLPEVPLGSFRDEIIESYDVRVLRDQDGRSVMLYGFRDPETLIIVRDEAAFAAVLTRFTGTSAK